MQSPASCCHGRPAHSRSRAFFQAAATLALIAGGVSGSLSTQALAVDYINPTGSTDGVQIFNTGTAPNLFMNQGTLGGFTGNTAGTVTYFLNTGTINKTTGNGMAVELNTTNILNLTNAGSIAGDYAVHLNLNSTITDLVNMGQLDGASKGVDIQGYSGNVNTITTLTNSGSIIGATFCGIVNSGVITTIDSSGLIRGRYCGIINYTTGTITTINISGTITGDYGESIANVGTIGTINILSDAVLNGVISNVSSGTIGTLNIYKTVTSGNFNSSSIDPTINGTLPGTTNRYANVYSGTTVGTFTNSVSLNTLTNAGTITTLSNNTSKTIGALTNSGTITTLTNSGTIGTITNTGTIGTLDMLSGSSITSSILNSGSIGTLNFYKTVTNGNFDTSSLVASISGNQPGTTNLHATVNSGTTVGTFTNANTLNTLTNAGTITTLTNSGTVGTLTNSGTIGTLNLLSGSTVTTGISNTGTINILNLTMSGITRGNYDVSVPGITGNQPITVNISGLPTDGHSYSVTRNGRRASVDVSGFGANTNAVRQVSNSVSRLANTNRLIESIGAKAAKLAAEPYATTSDLCADGAPAPEQVGNSDFWIRGFTGRNKVDATASSTDYINTYSGGAIGIDRDWSEDVRGGVFIGSGNMNNSLGGGLGGTETDLIFAGTYATKTWGTLFAKVGLTGGRGSNTGTRNIAAGTPETATADYNSWYVSPEVSVGKVYALGQYLGGDFSVTPMLSVRYVYASQEGYTETGATNNLTMNSSHSTTLEERAELKFSYATKAFNDYGVKVNASVGGIGQQNNGGAMSGTLLGAPLSFATPGDDNSTGFVGGLGFEINRGKYTFTASGDYVRLSGGNADLSANVVFSVKF